MAALAARMMMASRFPVNFLSALTWLCSRLAAEMWYGDARSVGCCWVNQRSDSGWGGTVLDDANLEHWNGCIVSRYTL